MIHFETNYLYVVEREYMNMHRPPPLPQLSKLLMPETVVYTVEVSLQIRSLDSFTRSHIMPGKVHYNEK